MLDTWRIPSIASERTDPAKEEPTSGVGNLWMSFLPERSCRSGFGLSKPPSTRSKISGRDATFRSSNARESDLGVLSGVLPGISRRKRNEPIAEPASGPISESTPLLSSQSSLYSEPAAVAYTSHRTASQKALISPATSPTIAPAPRGVSSPSVLQQDDPPAPSSQQLGTTSGSQTRLTGSSLSSRDHGVRRHKAGMRSRKPQKQPRSAATSSESEDTETNTAVQDLRAPKPTFTQIILRGLHEFSFGTFRLLLARPLPVDTRKSAMVDLHLSNPIKGNEAIWLAICKEICELEAVGLYIPITLFTNHGLNILVTQMRDIRSIRKISFWSLASWFGKYINTQHDLFQTEELTQMEEWKEAATHMIRWARTRRDNSLELYLTKHFEWLKNALSHYRQLHFDTVRDFDIEIRKGLHEKRKLPSFCRDWYRKQLIDFLQTRNEQIPCELQEGSPRSISYPSAIAVHPSRTEASPQAQTLMKIKKQRANQHYIALMKIQDQVSSIDQRNAAFCKIPPPRLPRIYRTKRPDILFRISTPYEVENFRKCMDEEFTHLKEKYPYLVSKLQLGFPMARNFPISGPRRTTVVPNGRSAERNMPFIEEELKKEVEAGRMSGPFTSRALRDILGSHFYCAPLTVDEHLQDDGTIKQRMCIDYSRPDGPFPSVNDHSEREDFPTNYDDARIVAEVIINAVPGTQAMTLDIAKFHRRTPIAPGHKAWFVVQGRKDHFYIQHCCPFGARPSEGNSGEIAAFVVDVWHARRVGPVLKWCDDFVIFRSPFKPGASEYSYDTEDVKNLISDLGVPWHAEKGVPFCNEFPYVGLLWNIKEKTVRLKEEKRQAYLEQVDAFLQRTECDYETAAKVNGFLSYTTFIYPLGRTYLSALNSFIAEFNGKRAKNIPIPPEVMKDMEWWKMELGKESAARNLVPPPRQTIRLNIASCKDGIGIILNDQCAAWKVAPGPPAFVKNRLWLAGAAVQLAVVLVTRGPTKSRNCSMTVQCDNQAFIEAFEKGRHRDPEINLTIREAYTNLDLNNVSFSLVYKEDRDALAIARKGNRQAGRSITPRAMPKNLKEYLVPRDESPPRRACARGRSKSVSRASLPGGAAQSMS
ncbi:hypothetical protein AX16_008207 [Volvariella volvacea WC 439]|nr:hypothetical protein AX16_008207 [Volvariella volvacea WC 439]